MTQVHPSPARYNELVEEAKRSAGKDAAQADSNLFASLFHADDGFYPRRQHAHWIGKERYVTGLSRRRWIENYFVIRPKSGKLLKLKLNPNQRNLEAKVLRIERAGMPVRVVILKARQQGFSTWVQGAAAEILLRGQHERAVIIGDTDKRAETMLNMATIARENMPRDATSSYNLKMDSRATYSLVWSAPISASMTIESAQKDAAGRGGTIRFLHITETAFWPNAAGRAGGVMESVPDEPGTHVYNESTANGDAGWFRDLFMASWEEKDKPIDPVVRRSPWVAHFSSWFELPDYRWSKTMGRPLPRELEQEILDTLDEEEKWLLAQTYLRRWTPEDTWDHVMNDDGVFVWRRVGVGRQYVSVDQLAWRRRKIEEFRTKGGIAYFNQEYPSRVDLAFKASGSRVFSPEVLSEYGKYTRAPLWRGELVPDGDILYVQGAPPGDEVDYEFEDE